MPQKGRIMTPRSVRVDGRVARATFVDKYEIRGTMDATETAPAAVGAADGSLTTRTPIREVDDMAGIHLTSRQRIALDYLGIARRELEDAARNRIRYVILGREYGLTHQAIGDALGIGEAAVRGLLKQHGGEA